MKTRLPGNFHPSPLAWFICFVLFLTASGCATNIPINPSETTDSVSHISVSKEDHVLVYTKDNRKIDMVVTEINSERKILIGRPVSQPKVSYYKPIAVYFSDIVSIEAKQRSTVSNSGVKNGSCDSTACKGVAYTLYTIIYYGFYPLLFSLAN
jgi:hypothetical protein